MREHRTSAPRDLFVNNDPAIAWRKAADIVSRMHPAFELSIARTLFNDVVLLFRGEYPGYYPIKTPYHDLQHTMDAFMCAVRLMHGMHVSGTSLSEHEITLVMAAMLLHDVGYAQMRNGKATGTGAQYTKDHIDRGIDFMRRYITAQNLPVSLASDLEPMIRCSDPALPLTQIDFPNARIRLLGQVVGTADLVGQMADRHYLEKLSALYREFEEGRVGDYRSPYDMLCKTHEFYAIIKARLDNEFNRVYEHLSFHFENALNARRNYYVEAIEHNMSHLQELEQLGEKNYESMLRRGIRAPRKHPPRHSH